MSLGSSGVDIDIVTGMPKTHGNPDARANFLKKKVDEVERYRNELLEDLRGSGGLVLASLTETVAAHAEEILLKDPYYRLWYDFMKKLGEKIELVPALMRTHYTKATGLPREGIPGLK